MHDPLKYSDERFFAIEALNDRYQRERDTKSCQALLLKLQEIHPNIEETTNG